jgi:TolB protein
MRRAAISGALALAVGCAAAASPADATARGHNGRIAFRVYFNADHTAGAIFTINPDGTGRRQVTHPRRSVLTTEPDWSPNGRWLVYTAYPGGSEDSSRILKIHPNGEDRTKLASSCTRSCLFDGFPQWAPHSRRIAFQRGLGPSVGQTKVIAIYTMRADGTHARRVTQRGADPAADGRYEDQAPSWAPNARRLAFERFDRTTGHQAIFTVHLDGSGLRRVTPWMLDASQPDYSPDGRWLLFRSHEESDTRGNVWLVRPNGNDLHAVTHTPDGAGKWQSGSFSPNGHKITAAKAPGVGPAGNADVYIMNLDGTGLRDVTGSPRWDSAPDWGPQRTDGLLRGHTHGR